ncbi:MAG: Crp/Fnr family transcriptional regulator [Phocaeicola plebeius]|nr:Crp/Fnr family transcriptional regulator [Phocaeicola plebeius]
MNVTMYDKLLQLPLFQGLCTNDLTHILEKVKLHFQNHKAGTYLIRQGTPCDQLLFLLDGSLTAEREDNERDFVLGEDLEAPFIIEPYSLYGMHPRHTASYLARTDVSVVTIEKSYILTVLAKYSIFQLNYLNLLSNRAQTVQERSWTSHGRNIYEKITNFLLLRCARPTGCKTLRIRMEDLAVLIGETRINVSKVLNEFQLQGLARLSRKAIVVPDMEALANYTASHQTDTFYEP